MKAGAGVWMWFQAEDAPKSSKNERKKRKKVLLFLRNAIWCRDGSLIGSFGLRRHITRGDAEEEKEETEGSEKWKSGALIRSSPFGPRVPPSMAEAGVGRRPNISFWKTSSALLTRFYCAASGWSAATFCCWELLKKAENRKCNKYVTLMTRSLHQNSWKRSCIPGLALAALTLTLFDNLSLCQIPL